MNWEDLDWLDRSNAPILVAIAALLLGGVTLDLFTSESLIIAIVYNVPIALSGLLLSRRVTLATVGVALLVNAVAGFFNLRAEGFETVVILNRAIAGASFLFVGYLTLTLHDASSRATTLALENTRAKREHDLRETTSALSEPLRPGELLERSAAALRALLRAESVIISGIEGGRFTLPHVSDPPNTTWSKEGDTVTWAVAATPQRDPPVMSVRLDDGLLTVGRWHRREADDLIVLARHPQADQSALLLGETLRSLEPLWERANLLENVEAQRQALEGRNEVIRDLVYAFSHDLRTPLMANAVTMQHALEGAYGELREDFKATLANGIQANKELLELADSLLLIARFESGEVPNSAAPVDLVKLVKGTVQRSAPAYEEAIKVEVNAPDKLTLRGRAGELGRVVQNLLDNAVTFSPPGGTVTLNLRRADEGSSAQGVRLEVVDEGPGITEKQRERLFKRFSSGRAGGGKGLGLYLARQIVEAHGGRIAYRPLEGGGSCFSVWLPVAQEVVTA